MNQSDTTCKLPPDTGTSPPVTPESRVDETQAPCESSWFPPLRLHPLILTTVLAFVYLTTAYLPYDYRRIWESLALSIEQLRATGDWAMLAHKPYSLGNLFIHTLHQAGGLELVGFVYTILFTLTATILYLALRRRVVQAPWATAMVVCWFLLSTEVSKSPGTHIIGPLFLSTLLLGASLVPTRRHPLFWAPLVMAIWANTDPSMIWGAIAMVFIWGNHLLTRFENPLRQLTPRRSRESTRFLLFTILTLLGAFCSPSSWQGLLSSLVHAGGSPRWLQPFDITTVAGSMFFSALVATAFILSRSQLPWKKGVSVLLMLASAVTLRNINLLPLWGVVWAWAIVPHCQGLAPTLLRQKKSLPKMSRTLTAMALALVALTWSPASGRWLQRRSASDATLADGQVPIYLADFLVNKRLAGATFAPVDWSDYLAWQSSRQDSSREIAPGRVTPQGVTLFTPFSQSSVYTHHISRNDYNALSSGNLRWLDIADHHGLRYLVLSRAKNRVLSLEVQKNKRCRILYQDQKTLLVELLRPYLATMASNSNGITPGHGNRIPAANVSETPNNCSKQHFRNASIQTATPLRSN